MVSQFRWLYYKRYFRYLFSLNILITHFSEIFYFVVVEAEKLSLIYFHVIVVSSKTLIINTLVKLCFFSFVSLRLTSYACIKQSMKRMWIVFVIYRSKIYYVRHFFLYFGLVVIKTHLYELTVCRCKIDY